MSLAHATLDQALAQLDIDKAGIIPSFLTRAELDDCLAAWQRLWDDPTVENANKRFIIDARLYREPAFARLATHPVVQDIARRVIGDFQLAGYSVVATPRNGDTPTTPATTAWHVDHCVYSDVPVPQSRDTFVCIWVNFEDLAMEHGPFALAVGTDKWNIGWEFFRDPCRSATLKVSDMGWDRLAAYNIGPAGSTAVYSGKTWHAGTTNCSDRVRKGLNMNFVPRRPLDTLRRNPFDICALSAAEYTAVQRQIGIHDYLIEHDPAMHRKTLA